MAIEVLYHKVQGGGRDSWCVKDTETNAVYMTYEYPGTPIPINNVDITTLTDEQLVILKQMLSAVEIPQSRMMAVTSTEQVREEYKFIPPKNNLSKWRRFVLWLKRIFKRK